MKKAAKKADSQRAKGKKNLAKGEESPLKHLPLAEKKGEPRLQQ